MILYDPLQILTGSCPINPHTQWNKMIASQQFAVITRTTALGPFRLYLSILIQHNRYKIFHILIEIAIWSSTTFEIMWGCESMRLCTYSRGSRNGVLHPTSQPAGQQPFVFNVSTTGLSEGGGACPPQILIDQLALSQPRGAYCSHHITTTKLRIFRHSYGSVLGST